jgi:hypothetical protein
MPAPSVTDLISQLDTAVESLEVRFRIGEVTADHVQQLKSAVDDSRLRLWALLKTGTSEEGRAFEERYLIRRAKELCGRLSTEIKAGTISTGHPEYAELSVATSELAQAIDRVRG